MTTSGLPQWRTAPGFWDALRRLIEEPGHLGTDALWQPEMWLEPDGFYAWIETSAAGQALLDGCGLQAWREALGLVHWTGEDRERLARWARRLRDRSTHGDALRLRRLRALNLVTTPAVWGSDAALISKLEEWVRSYNLENASRFSAAQLRRLPDTGERAAPPARLLDQLKAPLKQMLVTYGSGLDSTQAWPGLRLVPLQPEQLAFVENGLVSREERLELKLDLAGAITAPGSALFSIVSDEPITCCGSENILLVMRTGIWCFQCYRWC